MNTSQSRCKLCKYPGSDLLFLGCGCTIHARCIPMDLLVDTQETNKQHDSILPAANKSAHSICPLCQSGTVHGIVIEPLCFNDIEHAIALKKSELSPIGTNRHHSQKQESRKHPREEDTEMQVESPYLLLSNSNSSISCSGLSRGQQRTGRWTNAESALVEFLVTAFDQGLLPLPHGIKLNEFLGDILLCKSSRLTKKMKNAKLSTRSFVVGKPCAQFTTRDREKLSMLQESFLSSLSSESTRLVLKINLTKQWRTHFYNVCLQIDYPHVQGNAWNTSLQKLEKRATRAEEAVRSIRRRKMGLSPQYDGGTFVNPNLVFDFIKAGQPRNDPRTSDIDTTTASIVSNDQKKQKSRKISSSEEIGSKMNLDGDLFNHLDYNDHHGRPRTLSTDISISSVGHKIGRSRSFSEDFDALLDVLTDETTELDDDSFKGKTTAANKNSKPASDLCESLLHFIVKYMESNNLPFQHVDLWVPSFSCGESVGESKSAAIDQLSLYHAGFNSRRDINNEMARMLQEFGVYSSCFSFEPGKGLPGRVFESGVTSWECGVYDKHPNNFSRVEGADLCGVKTALAIPLNTAMMGRIVAILYSCESVPEDTHLARDIVTELTKYYLEQKLRMVLDSSTSSSVRVPAKLSEPKVTAVEKDETKSVFDFSREFIPVAHDKISKSIRYSKEPDSVILSKSSPSTLKTVNSSHTPMVPIVQRYTKELSRSSSQNEIQTTHYLHKVTTETFGSKVEGGEDNELASFLNQNMPVVKNSISAGQVSSLSDAKTLRPYFLSFRLLLLRPSNERTSRDNEIISVLKKSFRAYARDNRRDGKELANLLIKDWVCLKSTYSFQEATIQCKELCISENPHLPMASMPHTLVDSTYKPTPSAPPKVEQQISSDYHGTSTLLSIHPMDQFISDSSDNPSDQSSRVSVSSSYSSSKLIVDYKRYLPR